MATAVKSRNITPKVTRNVSQKNVRIVAGVDSGNNTYAQVCSAGKTVEEFLSGAWFREIHGDLGDFRPVSNTKGLSFKYLKGKAHYVGRTFMCGHSALTSAGSYAASLMGDDPSNKVEYGLPMTLFGLISQNLEMYEFDAVVVACTHDQGLSKALKATLNGSHEVGVLSITPDGDIEETLYKVNIHASVIDEGRGGLWMLSEKDLIDLDATNLLFDGGGGTFEARLFDGTDLVRSHSVPIGGNNIVTALLGSNSFKDRFPRNVQLSRALLEKAIRNGSWTYKKGNLDVFFGDLGEQVVKQFIPAWIAAASHVTAGNASLVDKTALIGGLFEMKCTAEEKPWKLTDMFCDMFDEYDFVYPVNPQKCNALGNYQLAQLVSADLGKGALTVLK